MPNNSQIPKDHFDFIQIGTIYTVFKEKFGTPQQSGYVKSAWGKIVLNKEINVSALEGLEESQFIWIIFVFHRKEDIDSNSKIMLSNWESNRPNPIGMTLAKLIKVEGRTIHVSGIDIINDTPILDIKPYHYKDAVEEEYLKKVRTP